MTVHNVFFFKRAHTNYKISIDFFGDGDPQHEIKWTNEQTKQSMTLFLFEIQYSQA